MLLQTAMSLLKDLPYLIICLFAFTSYKLVTDPDLVHGALAACSVAGTAFLEVLNLDALLPPTATVCD